MGRDTLKRLLNKINPWKGLYYDAEWDMWFDADTHPLSPTYKKKIDNSADI